MNERQHDNMSDKAYNITKHARERYAERILNKKDKLEINRYVAENYDKIDRNVIRERFQRD